MSLLAAVNYDPATVVTKPLTLTPMTAVDTTNLRLTFTPPASGNVLVRLAVVEQGGYDSPAVMLGVLDGAALVRRYLAGSVGYKGNNTHYNRLEAVFVVTGLAQVATTWDAAYGVEVAGNGFLKYGGPSDSVTTNAYGPFTFEVWTA